MSSHVIEPISPVRVWGVLPDDSDAQPEDVAVFVVGANVPGMTHSAYLADGDGRCVVGRNGRLLQTFGISAEDAIAGLALVLYTNHPKES